MNLFLVSFIAGAAFLLSFLLFFHPLKQNITANRWLSLFVFIVGCAFISTYMIKTGVTTSNSFVFRCLNSLQFLLAPSLYISILYFVNPSMTYSRINRLHFVPFILYTVAEIIWINEPEGISTYPLLVINKNTFFLVRDLLPLLMLFYVFRSYTTLRKHTTNLKLISSAISQIDLKWLIQFLFIISITVIVWLNDALFELPLLTGATSFIYAISIFFLAYFSIKQRSIFDFKKKYLHDISAIFTAQNELAENRKPEPANEPGIIENSAENPESEKRKVKRLSAEQLAALSVQLYFLMENEKLFLENDLNLAVVAEKMGISIHETSFLINEVTHDNFYNFINKYRIEEAKRLLASAKMEELNILGIAFASGFNSKTTFNTTFKKLVGISPSQYSREQKK